MYHLFLKEDSVAYNGKKLGADLSWKYVSSYILKSRSNWCQNQ